jgi:hypothetical protein
LGVVFREQGKEDKNPKEMFKELSINQPEVRLER